MSLRKLLFCLNNGIITAIAYRFDKAAFHKAVCMCILCDPDCTTSGSPFEIIHYYETYQHYGLLAALDSGQAC